VPDSKNRRDGFRTAIGGKGNRGRTFCDIESDALCVSLGQLDGYAFHGYQVGVVRFADTFRVRYGDRALPDNGEVSFARGYGQSHIINTRHLIGMFSVPRGTDTTVAKIPVPRFDLARTRRGRVLESDRQRYCSRDRAVGKLRYRSNWCPLRTSRQKQGKL